MHTWDVIEYMKDATTSSSASSNNSTRRASMTAEEKSAQDSEPPFNPTDAPSTPPGAVDEPVVAASPAHQRDLHQKKRRRRSSGIPPMNFNNPDDDLSSSPSGGSSPAGADREDIVADGQSTAMSLDLGDNTQRSNGSHESSDSTGSSARLDEALRQATRHAGTQALDTDDAGDMTMEMAEDETTMAFKPWVKKVNATPKPARRISPIKDQENINPFSSGKKFAEKLETQAVDEEGDDADMDVTKAMGSIVTFRESEMPESRDATATMDFTAAIGGIKSTAVTLEAPARGALKRRRSSAALLSGATSQGSPAKRPNRRSSVGQRRSSAEQSMMEDETMDFTMAVGGIQSNIQTQPVNSRRQSTGSSLEDETMDLTMAVGGIQPDQPTEKSQDLDEYEEMSMEFTGVLGGIQNGKEASPQQDGAELVGSPTKAATVQQLQVQSTPVRTPTIASNKTTPASAAKATPRASARKSPRKGIVPATPEAVEKTPEHKIPAKKSTPLSQQRPFRSPRKDGRLSTPTAAVPFEELKNLVPGSAIVPSPFKLPDIVNTVPAGNDMSPEQPPIKSTVALSDSIRLMSTPRKHFPQSPAKFSMTPKKEPTPQRLAPPRRKSVSPKKQARFEGEPEQEETDENDERISLQDFLSMTQIRFMDLTTTKRRHTAHPTKSIDFSLADGDDGESAADVQTPSLEDYVVAAACTVPEYEMYQHACHELKRFISGGRDIVRSIEAAALDENPALFRDYLSAPPDERAVMDVQFKNLKTNARLKTKEIWYEWRSNLLATVRAGLEKTNADFAADATALKKQEQILDGALPDLQMQHQLLQEEADHLKRREEELKGEDKEELEAARESLLATEGGIEAKKALIAALQQQIKDKETSIDAVRERKSDCHAEIKAAEKVREECRGWSASEVNVLKGMIPPQPAPHIRH